MASVGIPEHSFEELIGTEGRIYRGWQAALASTAGLAVGPSAICVMSFGAFAPYLQESFGWSVAATAFGATILSVMIMLVSPLQGVLADRIGARPLILSSIPLFGLGVTAMALMTGELWQFYLAWVVLPLFAVGLWPGAHVKVISTWFERRLGLAIAVATIGIGIGGTLLPLLVATISEAISWREAYVVLGLGSIALSWPAAWLFVHERGDSRKPGVRAGSSRWREGLRSPAFFWLALGFVTLGFVSSAMLVHQVGILIENGISRSDAILLQAILGLATIAGRLMAGWMLDRAHVRFVLPVFALAAFVALLVLMLGATSVAAAVCAAIVGMLIGGEIDVLGYVAKRYFGLADTTTFYGILFAVFQLGGAVGVALVGVLRGVSGSYDSGLIVLQVACLIGAGAFAALGPYRPSGSHS